MLKRKKTTHSWRWMVMTRRYGPRLLLGFLDPKYAADFTKLLLTNEKCIVSNFDS